MGVVVAYSILALVFLTLSTGIFKPKRWNDLTDKHVKILKFGCFFGFLLIMANIAARLI